MSMAHGIDFAGASADILDNISESLIGGLVQAMEAGNALSQQGPLYDNEIARHSALDIELGPDFDFDPMDLFGDEAYAFRNGADASLTLPCFTSEMF